MTVNHLVAGSNPASGATIPPDPKLSYSSNSKERKPPNYDTFCKNYDTNSNTFKRLYRVNKIYYYRRRVKQKLIRISLRTADIVIALKRKKILDLLRGSELYKLEMGDFKLMFEYDTEEELKVALENAQKIYMNSQLEKFREEKKRIQTTECAIEIDSITFEQLRVSFMKAQKQTGRTIESLNEYNPTFKKLIIFFKNQNIYELGYDDMIDFKEYLGTIKVRSKNLSKSTINKNLIYLKMFLKHIKLADLADDIILFEKQAVRKETPKKENYTQSEINNILTYDYKDKDSEKVIKIALYTGMRQGEIRRLSQEDIKRDERTDIYYFDIVEAKSEAGERQVPIHKDILDLVMSSTFPLLSESSNNKNAFGKKVRYQLYKSVDEEGKNFHTLRANFIDSIVENNSDNNNPFSLNIIQETVGHSGDDKQRLTLNTYKKGFSLKDKKDLIDRVAYTMD